MSFDDYVSQITHKYRLAVAIAVINTKPINKSIDQYIQELKDNINNDRMDTHDLDITICSDDFRLDDDNDNDEAFDNNDAHVICNDHVRVNDTQMTNDSIHLLHEIDFDHLCGNEIGIVGKNSSLSKVLDELKEIEGGRVDKITNSLTNNISQETYCETLKTQELPHNNVVNSETDGTYYQSIEMFNDVNENKNDPKSKADILYLTNTIVGDINPFDSQATDIYSVHGFSNNCTHYSQSQTENVNISNKYITRNRDKINEDNGGKNNTEKLNIDDFESIENDIYSQCAQNMDLYLNENQLINTNKGHEDIDMNKDDQIQDINEIECKDNLFSQVEQNIHETQAIVRINGKTYIEIDARNTQERDRYIDTNTVINEIDNVNIIQEDDMTDSQREIVPFKVIEELNKVKTYLNRKIERRSSYDGYSTESGYKSDGRGKSSHKSALQLSGTWLNQSAHCLFTYITCCQLAVTTQDITNEISLSLGRLIDRLHEEEKYPPFLEELLEAVEKLIQQVYNEDTSCENVLQRKEEYIQRIFLLNKSLHIQKYTIEKISSILENLHPRLTNSDSVFDTKNINELENVCYIFHILEIILIKYTKNKNLSSQNSSQPSQDDDKSFKKSSITDIWRKKWNPNYKELPIECTIEKKCVLLKCSDILNKIIVGCMDGYSLLAYSALKCFNVLQS